MALAIAPPNTAVRILLVSEGNETAGDLKEAAQTAASNKIPIDILPIHYQYKNEVHRKQGAIKLYPCGLFYQVRLIQKADYSLILTTNKLILLPILLI